MPTHMMSHLLADWTLIALVVLAVNAFAALVCGLTGYLPFARRSDAEGIRQRLADAVDQSERRRLDGAMRVSEFRRKS